MSHSKLQWWERFQKYYTEFPEVGLAVDLSRMNVSDEFFAKMEPRVQKALAAMAALEKGAIANPDENRMVGHYWLRNPALAPTPEIRKEIEEDHRPDQGLCRQNSRRENSRKRRESLRIICSLALAAPRSGLNLSLMPWEIRAQTSSNRTFLITPIRTAWIGSWQRLAVI